MDSFGVFWVFDLTDADYAGRDLLAQKMIVTQELWKMHNEKENHAGARLNALKEINAGLTSLLQMMRDLGFVVKPMPENAIERAKRLHNIIDSALPNDIELQERIIRAFFGVRTKRRRIKRPALLREASVAQWIMRRATYQNSNSLA